MYSRGIRTLFRQNIPLNAVADFAIAVGSRGGSPYYRVIGIRIIRRSVPGGGNATVSLTSDTLGTGNLYVSPTSIASGSVGDVTQLAAVTTPLTTGATGSLRYTSGFIQYSASIFFRISTTTIAALVTVDVEVDIEDLGRISPPTVSDNVMATIRGGDVTGTIVTKTYAVSGKLYLVGNGTFVSRGGASRSQLIVYDLITGLPTSLSLTFAGGSLTDVAVDPADGSIYLAGSFTSVNGTGRNRLAKVDAAGVVQSWNPNADAAVRRIVLDSGILYFCGAFSNVVGSARSRLAAVATDGTLQGLSITVTGSDPLLGLTVSGSVLYIYGLILTVNGVARNLMASIDKVTGANNPWPLTIGSLASGANVNWVVSDGISVWISGGVFSTTPARRCIVKASTAGVIDSSFDAAIPGPPSGNDFLYVLQMSLDGRYIAWTSNNFGNNYPLVQGVFLASTGTQTLAVCSTANRTNEGCCLDSSNGLYVQGPGQTASALGFQRYIP